MDQIEVIMHPVASAGSGSPPSSVTVLFSPLTTLSSVTGKPALSVTCFRSGALGVNTLW
ncbi:MAG: hypothetical protein ABW166_14920 [Sedimenticola sp.]